MTQPLRVLVAAGAVGVVLLTLLPLGGLLAGIVDPPPSAFGNATPTLGELLERSRALQLLATTLALAVVVTAVVLPLGTWLGWVEQRGRYPGARSLGVLGLMPLAMPSYILASTVRESFGPGGWIGASLGLPVFTGFWPAALVLALITIPYVQLLVSAALMRMSASEEEAARTLGAARGTRREELAKRVEAGREL